MNPATPPRSLTPPPTRIPFLPNEVRKLARELDRAQHLRHGDLMWVCAVLQLREIERSVIVAVPFSRYSCRRGVFRRGVFRRGVFRRGVFAFDGLISITVRKRSGQKGGFETERLFRDTASSSTAASSNASSSAAASARVQVSSARWA